MQKGTAYEEWLKNIKFLHLREQNIIRECYINRRVCQQTANFRYNIHILLDSV